MTEEQKTLFTPPAPTGNLTIRQQFVYDSLQRIFRDGGQGASADEIGARLHERRGKHPSHTRCYFCATDGNAALVELRAKGLAKRRRAVGWVPLGQKATESDSPGRDEDPFPDGF